MTTDTPSLLMGYFPMWGATFDSDGVGFIDKQGAIYIPGKDEWRHIEKTDVWMERWGTGNPHSLDGPVPPVCLVMGAPIHENEEFAEAFDRLYVPMVAQMQDALLTLRLFKAGWFLDPGLAEQIFTFDAHITRIPGPYRQIFLGGVPDTIPPPYHLSIDELMTKANQVTPLTTMRKLIGRYRERGTHASADIAIENFHRSYGLFLNGTQRVAFLFTALDAMFGGMSVRNIGKIRLRSAFRDRITVALEAATRTTMGATITPHWEANWLDSEGRRIRNAVMHGNPSEMAAEAEESYSRIQAIVRLILPQYFEFSIKWKSQAVQIRPQYGIAEDCGVTAAYNKVLDAHASGVADAMDMLKRSNAAPRDVRTRSPRSNKTKKHVKL
jgi:hypothetical protein